MERRGGAGTGNGGRWTITQAAKVKRPQSLCCPVFATLLRRRQSMIPEKIGFTLIYTLHSNILHGRSNAAHCWSPHIESRLLADPCSPAIGLVLHPRSPAAVYCPSPCLAKQANGQGSVHTSSSTMQTPSAQQLPRRPPSGRSLPCH